MPSTSNAGTPQIDENTVKASQVLTENIRKMETETTKNRKAMDGLNKAWKDLKSTASDTTKILGDILKIGVTFQLVTVAKKMIEVNSELHRTIVNSGKGAEALKTFKNTAIELSTELGATHENANKIVKILAEKQFAGSAKEIKEAASASYELGRAFDIDYEEVTKNTVELQKWGQVSTKTTTAMYADMMKVAQANGLTKEGVTAIMKTTKEWSGMLKAFGKTAPMDVQRYNMSLAKTVSALEKVGVSAQTSTELLEDLTDPTHIEKNIPKYAALGISITDAISGNIDPEAMGAGLKEFGEKLKQMGPIAGAQYAQAMGVSYKTAIKAASADMAEASKVDMTPEEKSTEAIKQLTEATKDMPEKMQDAVQKMGGKIRKLGPIFLLVIGVASKMLMKKLIGAYKKISEERKKMITETAEEEINISEKANKTKFEEEKALREATNALALEDTKTYLKRIEELSIKHMAPEEAANELKKMHAEDIKNAEAKNKEILQIEHEKQVKLAEEAVKLEKEIKQTKDKSVKETLKKELKSKKELHEKQKEIIKNVEAEQKTSMKKLEEDQKKMLEKMKNDFTKINQSKFRNIGYIFGKIAGGWKKDVGNIFSKLVPKKMASGIKGIGNALGNKITNAATNAKKILSSVKIGFKQAKEGTSKSKLGGIIKSLGVLGIVGTLIGKVLSKIGDPLEKFMDELVDAFVPIFKALMPPIMKLIKTLVATLLPPILRILAGLMKILSVLLKPLFGILKGLGNIPGLGFLKDIATGLEEAIGPNTQNALNEAAESVSKLKDKTEENTEALNESTESKPEQLTNNGGTVMVSKAVASPSSTESSSSSSSNTEVAKNETEGVQAQKSTNEQVEKMNNKLDVLIQKFSEYIEKISDENNNKKVSEMSAAINRAFGFDSESGESQKVIKVAFVDGNNINPVDTTGLFNGSGGLISSTEYLLSHPSTNYPH